MFAHVEDMTPARFDVLYAMWRGESSQGAVTRALGLARQTVWKMVERLVQLGLITKTKAYRGRIDLDFTEEGWRRFRQALDAAFNERWPLPKAALTTEGDVPRYWNRPELSDHSAIRATARRRPHVRPRDGGPPLEKSSTPGASSGAATGAADGGSGQDGPPVGASREELQRYYDALYDGSYVRPPAPKPKPPPVLPKKRGREVAKIYSAFAWRRCPRGLPPKRERHLLYLDDLISLTQDIATALGNEVWPLYSIRFTDEFDH
jgi:DNA-binding MarR family transcriptional regulator